MSLKITKEDLIAYTEVDYIINHMNERYISKIPQRLKDFFATMKDDNTTININPRLPLQQQGLQKYTLEILAILNIKYWCSDPERRKELIEKMKENQDNFETHVRERFNEDNIFENSNNNEIDDEDMSNMNDDENNLETENIQKSNNEDKIHNKLKQVINNLFRK